MKIGPVELSFPQWSTSKWTLLAFRAIVTLVTVVMLPLLTWVIWYTSGSATARVAAVEATVAPLVESVSGVQKTQTVRAADSELFQTEVRTAISDIKAGQRSTNATITGVKSDVYQVSVDVGVIKRLLQSDRTTAFRVPPELEAPTIAAATPAPWAR